MKVGLADGLCLRLHRSSSQIAGEIGRFGENVDRRIEAGESLQRAVELALKAMPVSERHFVFRPTSRDEPLLATDELIYHRHTFNGLSILSQVADEKAISVAESDIASRVALDALTRCASGRYSITELEDLLKPAGLRLIKSLRNSHLVVSLGERDKVIPTFDEPGIYRLQHAGLFIRTKKTGVLIDPHLHSSFERREGHDGALGPTFQPRDFERKVDAVLISHSHADHYNVPSLMMLARDTLIIVPHVSRETIICENMAEQLRGLGFSNVISPKWNSPPIHVGDCEIAVLPFFGEQPTLTEYPAHPDVWNHGNTYLVRTPEQTAWCLIDAGDDARGRMADVGADVKSRFGRPDVLLSNLRRFRMNFFGYINSGLNWATLSANQISRFNDMRTHCLTLGPEGVAQVCQSSGARDFLPYAHWWDSIGAPPNRDDIAGVAALRDELSRIGSDTKVLTWRIGDRYFNRAIESPTSYWHDVA